jgi:hypothetical protein
MARAIVVVHTLDWLSFVVAVTVAPALLGYELGFIGEAHAALGPLGSLAWKMAGLSFILALSTYVHPRPRRALLVLVFLAGVVGVIANAYALMQVV